MFCIARLRQTPHLFAVRTYSSSASGTDADLAQRAKRDLDSNSKQPQHRLAAVDLGTSVLSNQASAGGDTPANTLPLTEQSGQTALQKLEERIKKIADQRRMQRLERESQQVKAGHVEGPLEQRQAKKLHRPANTLRPEGVVQSAGVSAQSNPSRQRTNRPAGAGGSRPPRKASNSGGNGPRSRNRRETESAEDEGDGFVDSLTQMTREQIILQMGESEEFLDSHCDEPTSILPTISPDLSSIFRVQKPDLELVLSKVPSGEVPSLKLANHVLRRFGGDYRAFSPPLSKAIYTTPVEQLPIGTQLELAMAKSRDMDLSAHRYMSKLVSKTI